MHFLAKTALALATSVVLASCGSDEDDEETATETSYTFDGNISAIINKSCIGATGCHGTAEGNGSVYQANRAEVVADATSIIDRIQRATTASGFMPPTTSSQVLSSGDRQILLDYLAQTVKN